jgi:sRNA-binding protein
MATSKSETSEIITELAKLYPGAFSTDSSRVRPLAIGLKELLLQHCKRSPRSIENAMRRYTGSTGYLNAMVEGAARVGLDGQSAGFVTMPQAEYAQRRLAKMAQRLAAKPNAAPTTAAAKAPPAPKEWAVVKQTCSARNLSAPQTGPRRLGLADLKRAAEARRTGGACEAANRC